jgi:hypothetical protein
MMSTQAIYTMTDRHMATQALRVRELNRMLKEHEANNPPRTGDGPTPSAVTWNNQTFSLSGDLIRVGRAPQNEIVIGATGVSRFHCQIKRENDKLILEDLNSTNGTHVAGQMLVGPFELHAGDEVFLCNEKLVFNTD